MVGRIVGYQTVHAPGLQDRECRPGSLARRQRAAGRSAVSPGSRNLASRVRTSVGSQPVWCRITSSAGSAAPNRRRLWFSSPKATNGPAYRVPARSGSRPTSASTRVVLPEPLGPASRTRAVGAGQPDPLRPAEAQGWSTGRAGRRPATRRRRAAPPRGRCGPRPRQPGLGIGASQLCTLCRDTSNRAATSLTRSPACTASTARYRCSTTDICTSANPGPLTPQRLQTSRDQQADHGTCQAQVTEVSAIYRDRTPELQFRLPNCSLQDQGAAGAAHWATTGNQKDYRLGWDAGQDDWPPSRLGRSTAAPAQLACPRALAADAGAR
jgi:hypothetical protein